jgi:NEDD8-activating enzyme E1
MWSELRKVLERPSPFGNETGTEGTASGEFDPGPALLTKIQSDNVKVVVLGAGGLGCELLKDLALSGFTNIHVIDMDTIDITNLNRQFLFRQKDVGGYKADTAAAFVMSRVKGCTITPHRQRLQDPKFDDDFYRQFNVVIGGLDNVAARRWMNSKLVHIAKTYDQIIPFIDGGTSALKGHVAMYLPNCTACFECTMDSFTEDKTPQICTIASKPRNAMHCVAWAFMLKWPEVFPDKTINNDSPEDMQWIFETAKVRAQEFGITGVTYFYTLGVVKNVIPAVASTNAIVSAISAHEALKIVTYCNQSIDSYMFIQGDEGQGGTTMQRTRKEDCIVCCETDQVKSITVSGSMPFDEFLGIKEVPEDEEEKEGESQVTSPLSSYSLGSKADMKLVIASTPSGDWETIYGIPLGTGWRTHANLSKPLSELVTNGATMQITSSALDQFVTFVIELEEETS